MVRIYTDKDRVDKKVLEKNVNFFRAEVNRTGINDTGVEIMKVIDGATDFDRDTGTVITPFGSCNVTQLSTGCLTALNIAFIAEHNMDLGVDITLCGANAIEAIFSLVDGRFDIPLVLRHRDLVGCADRDYLVNDTDDVSTMFGLVAALSRHQD